MSFINEYKKVDLSNNQYGCYCVYNYDTKEQHDYLNKVEALIALTSLKKLGKNVIIYFRYYDNIWKTFDFSLCGKTSLDTLYKERALQLRDKYQYLILKYSGGSDSHNILMTFLKNNIKLDALYINWPLLAKEKKLYKPNKNNFSSDNELSEWDYTIKPDLDYIRKNHPEIEIHIDDWLKNLTEMQYVNDSHFQKQNHFLSLPSIYRHQFFTTYEKKLVDKGFKVGIIDGADKPNLYISEKDSNKVIMRFIDWPLQHTMTYSGYGVEYFYWTPDLPLLPVEMAYQVFLYYKNNKAEQHLLYSLHNMFHINEYQRLMILENVYERKNTITKKILYPYWDNNRFQIKKDLKIITQSKIGKPQDWVFWEHHETKDVQDKWNHYMKSYFEGISPDHLSLDSTGKPIMLKPIYSMPIGGDWKLN